MKTSEPTEDNADLCAVQNLYVCFDAISDKFRTRHRKNPDRHNAMICSSMVAVSNAFRFLSDEIRKLSPD